MDKKQLSEIKEEIEELRQEMYTYMEYPGIFEMELMETNKKINKLINQYMILNNSQVDISE